MWNRPIHVLTRAQLYDLVWAEPVETVAHRYKLSGNGLAKICKRHRIPLPPRGYWAKVQHGHKPRRQSLRPAKSADDETVRITEGVGPRPAPPTPPDLEPPIVAAVERALLPENRIELSDGARRLHRLVLEMARTLNHAWDGKRIAPEPIEQRRRLVLNAFIRGVEQARGTVGPMAYNGYFDVTIYGSTFRMSCSQPERRVKVPLDAKELRNRPSWETRDWKTETRPSGVLRIRVQGEGDRHKDFTDADGVQLEDRFTDVLVYLLRHTITVAERDRRAEAARQAKAEADRRRHEEDLRRLKLEEKRRREHERAAALVEEAARWRKAQEVRQYVAAARDEASEAGPLRYWPCGSCPPTVGAASRGVHSAIEPNITPIRRSSPASHIERRRPQRSIRIHMGPRAK